MTETTEQSLDQPNDKVSIGELYPELTPAEREEAAYYLNRYLDLIERIYDRVNG